MKSEEEINEMISKMRESFTGERVSCVDDDNTTKSRIGTLLWVLDRENEPIKGPLKQTDEDVFKELGIPTKND